MQWDVGEISYELFDALGSDATVYHLRDQWMGDLSLPSNVSLIEVFDLQRRFDHCWVHVIYLLLVGCAAAGA